MASKLSIAIIVGIGVLIVAFRAFTAPTGAQHSPLPLGSPTSTTSTTSTAGPTAVSSQGPTPTPDITDQQRPTLPPASASEYVVIDNSPAVPYDQAKNWGTGLINSAHLLRLAINGAQANTVLSLEEGTGPYADIVSAIQQAQANSFTPTTSGDIIITQALLSDMNDSDKAFVSRWHQTPTNQAWLVTYKNQVAVTYGPNGQTLTIDTTYAEGGYLKNDPNLGQIWVDSFRMDCSGLGASLSICQLPSG